MNAEFEKLISNEYPIEYLRNVVSGYDLLSLRDFLLDAFSYVRIYRDKDEWNRAVRICECLAVIGWGEESPLFASASIFLNGSYMTCFSDKFGDMYHLFATWNRKTDTHAIDPRRSAVCFGSESVPLTSTMPEFNSDFQSGHFQSQRNRIPENPLSIKCLLENALPQLEPVKKLVKSLNRHLNGALWQKNYGNIFLSIGFLFEDEYQTRDEALQMSGSGYEYGNDLIFFDRFSKKYMTAYAKVFLSSDLGNKTLLARADELLELIEYILMEQEQRLRRNKTGISFQFSEFVSDMNESAGRWKATIHGTQTHTD